MLGALQVYIFTLSQVGPNFLILSGPEGESSDRCGDTHKHSVYMPQYIIFIYSSQINEGVAFLALNCISE